MAGVSLRVDPAHVCRRARALVQDGEHMAAVQVLGDSYEGLDIQTAFSILDGSKTLAPDGSGGARLVADDSEEAREHREILSDLYGHRVRIDGKWHEPYAYVNDVNRTDRKPVPGMGAAARERAWKAWSTATEGVTEIPPERTEQAEDESQAPLHYADEPNAERVAYLKVGFYFDGGLRSYSYMRDMGCPVLFRPCDAPPPWMKGAGSLLEAAQAGIASLRVEMRGHRVETGQIDRMATMPDPFRKEQFVPRLKRELAEAALAAVPDDRSEARRASENVIDEPNPPGYEDDVLARLPALREAIVAQAARSGGFVEIDLGSGPVSVPRAPFERWALKPVGLDHLAPEWRPVSPPDLKLQNDNRDHSDWMVGSGLDPFAWHGHGEDRRRLREAGYEAMYALQEERAKVRHAVLAGSGAVSGPVWIARRGELPPLGAVVVLPDASPSWLPAVQAAVGKPGVGAVIVEQGGAMAHLVTVLREGGAPVIRWPGAREALAQVSEARVDCADGTVEILGYDVVVPDDLDPEDDASPAPGM